MVQIEGRKAGIIKFGNRGGESGGWCHQRTRAVSDSAIKRSEPHGTIRTIARLTIGPRGVEENMLVAK